MTELLTPMAVSEQSRVWSVPGRSWLGSVVGLGGLLLLWQLVGATIMKDSHGVPTPTMIVHQMSKDGFQFYWNNASSTVSAAARGWLWGNLLAIGLAFLVFLAPVVERPVLQLGIVSYCLPIVAIGTIFAIVFSGDLPKVILAAMAVFYTTLVGAILGLRSADAASIDVIHAYGGGSWKKLVKVRLRASLPSLFAALRIAAPAAVLGAIIGEYLGAEKGLGVSMINSQQALEVPRTWAIALVATGVSGLGYGVTALIGRFLTPWAPKAPQ
jgi:ABC-type nitrate/sulfonate/bicarbonate transport system permease component